MQTFYTSGRLIRAKYWLILLEQKKHMWVIHWSATYNSAKNFQLKIKFVLTYVTFTHAALRTIGTEQKSCIKVFSCCQTRST